MKTIGTTRLFVDVQGHAGTFPYSYQMNVTTERLALFGPSGAGKTTLLGLIAGLVRPEQGRITVDGQVHFDAQARRFLPAHLRRCGYVFQDGKLFPHMTVAGNLRFAARRSRNPSLADGLADTLDLTPLLDRNPGSLSGGEIRRVALARALVSDPEILLLDEPFVGLDEVRKSRAFHLVETLRSRFRLPAIFVTHDLADVATFANHVACIDGGKIVGLTNLADFLADQAIRSLAPGRNVLHAVALSGQVPRFDPNANDKGLSYFKLSDNQTVIAPCPTWFSPDRASGIARIVFSVNDIVLASAVQRGMPGSPQDMTQSETSISMQNRLMGSVTEIAAATEELGPIRRIRLEVAGQPLVAQVTDRALGTLNLSVGCKVAVYIKCLSLQLALQSAPPSNA